MKKRMGTWKPSARSDLGPEAACADIIANKLPQFKLPREETKTNPRERATCRQVQGIQPENTRT